MSNGRCNTFVYASLWDVDFGDGGGGGGGCRGGGSIM